MTLAFAGVGKVQPMVFESTDAPACPTLVPVFTHLALAGCGAVGASRLFHVRHGTMLELS